MIWVYSSVVAENFATAEVHLDSWGSGLAFETYISSPAAF